MLSLTFFLEFSLSNSLSLSLSLSLYLLGEHVLVSLFTFLCWSNFYSMLSFMTWVSFSIHVLICSTELVLVTVLMFIAWISFSNHVASTTWNKSSFHIQTGHTIIWHLVWLVACWETQENHCTNSHPLVLTKRLCNNPKIGQTKSNTREFTGICQLILFLKHQLLLVELCCGNVSYSLFYDRFLTLRYRILKWLN